MSSPATLPTDVRLMLLATSLLGWVLVAMLLAAGGLWAVRHPVWTVRGLEVVSSGTVPVYGSDHLAISADLRPSDDLG